MASEERELRLVDNVDFKILGVANNEAKLQELLSRYLAPLLLKAASEHAAVRTKVITICSRLKTFIQPPGVVLPVEALIDQYKNTDSTLVRQLDMTFIQHSVPRLEDYDRRKLVPKIFKGIASDAASPTGSTLFSLLLSIVTDVKLPSRGSKEDELLRDELGLSQKDDAAWVAQWFGKVLLLRISGAAEPPMETLLRQNPALTASDLTFLRVDNAEGRKVYGRIAELKAKIMSLLSSGAFTDEERFLPALYAASTSDSRVYSVGEDLLKRSGVSLEDEALVRSLFAAHSRMPAPIRTRILGLLSKSALAATMGSEIEKVVDLDFRPQLAEGEHPSQVPGALLQPASALERTKLHKALFQFLAWVSRFPDSKGPQNTESTPSQSLTRASRPVFKGSHDFQMKLIDKMRDYVVQQGWPVPTNVSSDDLKLRCTSYEIIGALVSMSMETQFQGVSSLAGWLFRSLSEDPTTEAVVSIDGALSTLSSLASEPGETQQYAIFDMLLTYMLLPDEKPAVRSVRHAAVKWANRCLPFSFAKARWIDILAIRGRNNERSDVVEEGRKGLDPWSHFAHAETKGDFPSWIEMLATFFGDELLPMLSDRETDAMDIDSASVFRNFDGQKIAAYPVAVNYCKQMLLVAALDDFELGPNWEVVLDARIKNDLKTRTKVKKYLSSVDEAQVGSFLNVCLEGVVRDQREITEDCLNFLVSIASLSPRAAIGYVAERAASLIPFTTSNSKTIQSLAAKAFGILAAHPANNNARVDQLSRQASANIDSWQSAIGAQLNAAEGSFLAVAHLSSRMVFYGRSPAKDLPSIEEVIDPKAQQSTRTTAMDACGQMWAVGLLPDGSRANLGTIIKNLAADARTGSERAIWALGKLALAIDDVDVSEENALSTGVVGDILGELFKLYELRQVDVHFAVGEALTSVVACWESDAVKLTLDVDSPATDFQKSRRSLRIKALLDKLFKDCKSTKPSLLKASGLWLFSVVQYCAHLDEIQQRLREAQVAFMRLLSARDELVQETASRGLSLVYERGDASLREDLVRDLVSAFTGSGVKIQVEEETELFDAGQLPTGEGQSVTSYKDIVDLANEVGDQTLVYKFMSLASNAATWSTRSAFGRFGLSSILSESEVDPKLYPKLFRYRFDPNPNVQRSMNDIWKALVKDSNVVMDKHFDDIMDDLLKSILGREWRMREASCAAVLDLIQGRPFEKYEKYYQDIWKVAVKVLDDIKGSVRKAAFSLCFHLSNTLTRQLEEGGTSASTRAMMEEAIPFLLSPNGIESGVEEVKLFSLVSVVKIAKTGGNALKPFIPTMIPHFLGLLSTIEPDEINFSYQRAAEETREQIDRMRSAFVRQSPIADAIDHCLRNIDGDVMQQLMPPFEDTIKTALGMPTKVGCSHVLVTLFTRHSQTVKPFASQLLRLMEKQAFDKNDEVSKGYAHAAAYMMRSASDAAQQQYAEHCIRAYFMSEGETRRQKAGDMMVALSKISPDQFSALESVLLPFSYMAAHDLDGYTSKGFNEVWNQHSGSGRTVARYVPEICSLVQRSLDSAQWPIRHTGALTVGAMVKDVAKVSDSSGQMSDLSARTIWPVLDKALALKTFPGKEKLLDCFPIFVEKTKSLWSGDAAIAAQMKKIAIREAKRNNAEYRVHAFKNLWQFAQARKDLDMIDEIAAVVKPHLDDFVEEDKMEIDSKNDIPSQTASSGLEALGRGYSAARMEENPQAVLAIIMKLVKPYLTHTSLAPIKRAVWYSCVEDAMNAAQTQGQGQARGPVALDYFLSLDPELADVGTETQRITRARAVVSVLKARARGVFGELEDGGKFKEVVARGMEGERSLDVRKVLKEAVNHLS